MYQLLLAVALAGPPVEPPQQVIVVSAGSWSSQRATLRRFESSTTGWVRRGAPVRAWLGSNGLAPKKVRRQNTGTTPAGVFTLPSAFGRVPGGRIRLPYHRITPTSYWPYDPHDPRTYNVLQPARAKGAHWRDDGVWSERLLSYGRQYRLAVVIGYNLPGPHRPADTAKGGGIFLHVAKGRPTAGCVSIPEPAMKRTIRWLDPERSPRIVIGPRSMTKKWRRLVGVRAGL